MANFRWPIYILEEYNVPLDKLMFLDGYAKENDETYLALQDLQKEHEMLKETSAKQERYIAELEKQLSLLQKTLDLIDKNGGGGDG